MVFIEAPAFTRHVPSYLTDDEYRRLQEALLANPEAGTYQFADEAQVWLMTLYDKDELKDLTAAEKRALRAAINAEREARAARRPTARRR